MADALSIDPQIKGLRPAVGRRQVNERFVMSGQNFLVDAKGPYAEFGSELMFHHPMYEPESAQTFEVEDEIFIVNNEGFFVYDKVSNALIPRYVFASAPTGDYPWSSAHVGGTYYFSRLGVASVIAYNPLTRIWTNFTTDVPTSPSSCAVVAGRLLIVGATQYAWSALDNGMDLAPSTTTGAGIQSLAIIANGTPLGVFTTDDGCIVYTSEGLVKVESIQSVNPFRHYVLITKIKPINQFTVVDNDGEHIFLAESGFYTTRGKKPERWQPLMSEYFHRDILPLLDFSEVTHLRLWYNYHRQWLFVSLVTVSGNDYLYDTAWVLYVPRDEWGMFNRQHYSIGEYHLDDVEFESYNCGYIDSGGHIQKFDDIAGVEVSQIPGDYFQNHLSYEILAYQVDGVYIMSTVGQTFPSREFINLPTSDLYVFEYQASYVSPDPLVPPVEQAATVTLGEDWNNGSGAEDWNVLVGSEDWNLGDDGVFPTVGAFGSGLALYATVIATPVFTPLNASVLVGLYRLSDQLVPDRLSFITDIMIGNKDTDDFNVAITGSLDGYNQFEDQTEVPPLIKSTSDMNYYTCYNNGIYHYVLVDATANGQTFHLKLLELSGTLGGRL